MKIDLQFLGEKRFEPRTERDTELVLAHLGVGDVFTITARKQERSGKQNRAFWAVVTKAWVNQRGNNWRSVEHLRQGAFCAIGHCTTYELPIPKSAKRRQYALAAQFAAELVKATRGERGRYAFARITDEGLAVDVADSWSYEELGHRRACQVFDQVIDWLIENVVPGITRDELLKEAKWRPDTWVE